MNVETLNGLTLAYIGDSYYELYIRNYLVSKGYQKVNMLHNLAVDYTSGKAQAEFIHYLMNNNILDEKEINVFKHGRNAHIASHRKNIDIQTYLDGTGFEALMGYYYLTENDIRFKEIMEILIKHKEEEVSINGCEK